LQPVGLCDADLRDVLSKEGAERLDRRPFC
jgi:hypothetical protein